MKNQGLGPSCEAADICQWVLVICRPHFFAPAVARWRAGGRGRVDAVFCCCGAARFAESREGAEEFLFLNFVLFMPLAGGVALGDGW